jgi:hypothetical protein
MTESNNESKTDRNQLSLSDKEQSDTTLQQKETPLTEDLAQAHRRGYEQRDRELTEQLEPLINEYDGAPEWRMQRLVDELRELIDNE